MTLRTFVALCAILAMLAISMADNGAREARAADTILELPVSFQVVNTNTSGAACPFDGLPYTVRGHLVGPQSIIYGHAAPDVLDRKSTRLNSSHQIISY